jgi:hypothetical protein
MKMKRPDRVVGGLPAVASAESSGDQARKDGKGYCGRRWMGLTFFKRAARMYNGAVTEVG